jgi:hypothetical protein
MVELLSIPLKKGADLDLVKPLKTLIASTFSTADKPENYTDALSELQRLRQLSVRCATFITLLLYYFYVSVPLLRLKLWF